MAKEIVDKIRRAESEAAAGEEAARAKAKEMVQSAKDDGVRKEKNALAEAKQKAADTVAEAAASRDRYLKEKAEGTRKEVQKLTEDAGGRREEVQQAILSAIGA